MKKKSLNKSEQLFLEAQDLLVGGVNSPVRSFRSVGGIPRFIREAKGAWLTDEDNKRYVDFVGSWGPMILGHNAPGVVRAIQNQLKRGTSFGAPTALEVDVARFIKNAVPSIERLRMTSSGTEATMSAIRLARAATKRERLIKFDGGYHGHSDSLLVSAGSGATTFGVPSSAGVPEVLAHNTWVMPYNDRQALDDVFRRQGPNIAAVIIEPTCGNMGVVLPKPGFLELVRELTSRAGAILIFDEVMTGFRLGLSGAQGVSRVMPDLTCFGKIIGGGLPVGAFGGRKDLMDLVAPLGPVYQAGTLSGNPLAMAAGLATLNELKSTMPYDDLAKTTKALCHRIEEEARRVKIPVVVNRAGSMFTVFFAKEPVTDYFSAMQADVKLYARFFHALLKEGVYFPPSQFEAAFVSTAHDAKAVRHSAQAFRRAFDTIRSQ